MVQEITRSLYTVIRVRRGTHPVANNEVGATTECVPARWEGALQTQTYCTQDVSKLSAILGSIRRNFAKAARVVGVVTRINPPLERRTDRKTALGNHRFTDTFRNMECLHWCWESQLDANIAVTSVRR